MGTTYRRVTQLGGWLAIAVLALVMLRQSLLAFRTSQTERRRIVRYGLQLALAAATVSFGPSAYGRAAFAQYRSQPLRELEAALQQVAAAALAANGEIPEAVSAADLDATGQLSEDARRWLAGSRVALRPSAPRATAKGEIRFVQTNVSFPSGSTFRMLYTVPSTR